MYYNLNDFGKEIVFIRKKHNLTRKQLSKLSFVSVETIRRIETGKYLPSHRILDDLSKVLKTDLNKLVLDFRIDDFETFYNIKSRLEAKFDRNEFQTLDIEYNDFKKLLPIVKNEYFQNIIRQLMLLIEAVALNKKEKMPYKAFEKLIKAIHISIPEFSLSNYQSHIYNSTEIRILMNIALILRKTISNKEALAIMVFCMNNVDTKDKIYPKICHNLAGIYLLLKKYESSLKFCNLGIKYCIEKRKLNGLNLLYYTKGIVEYNLKRKEYMESLNKSLSLCQVLEQDNLKESIIYKCKKFYNIEVKAL